MKRLDCALASVFCLGLTADIHLPISRLIGEPLADDTPKHTVGASLVIDAVGNALIIPEIELREIAVKMFLSTVLIDALHSALEDRKVALDGVGVNVATPVFTAIMADHAVFGEILANRIVLACFISHQPRFTGEVLIHQRPDGAGFEVVYDHAPHLAGLAIHQRQYLVFVSVAASLFLVLGFDGLVVADEGLVNLDRAAVSTERGQVARAHGLSDPVAHKPSGLESDAQSAVQLVSADPLLARADQEDRLQPDMQLDVAGLEDGADLDGERLAARIALVSAYAGALALHLAILAHNATVRANGAFWPDVRLDKFICGVFIVKSWFGEYGHDGDPFCVPKIYRHC